VECHFGYPHALQSTTTIDNLGKPHYRQRTHGDEMVVPHCLLLIRSFDCHVNFEVANTSHLFQYLFKYIHKPPDRARYTISENVEIDEIQDYWDGQYLSMGEAAWRILGFHVMHKHPSVSCLPVHLPGSRSHHQYHRTNGITSTLSLLNRYFNRSRGTFVNSSGLIEHFDELTYLEYHRLFRLIPVEQQTGTTTYPESVNPVREVS